jgi:hypothetical protein
MGEELSVDARANVQSNVRRRSALPPWKLGHANAEPDGSRGARPQKAPGVTMRDAQRYIDDQRP